jgi:hypothetical protein
MPRGFVRAIYVDDDGTSWSLRVDADEFEELSRGWTATGLPVPPPVPRGWLPRRVVGLDSRGSQQTARVGHVGADLWTGAALTFVLMLSDGTTDTATVVARQGELRIE